MRPYFDEDGITIYHGDCREVLPELTRLGCTVESHYPHPEPPNALTADPRLHTANGGHCDPLADLLLADPPYGISYRHGARAGGALLGSDGEAVVGDDAPFDPTPFMGFPAVVLWGANHYADRLPAARGWLVWDKRDGIPSNDQSDCELAWTNRLTVARLFTRYWNGGGIGEERWHPTQKPIALMRWCAELFPDAATILDPFMGSGTTLRAAKDLGRKAIGIEIEEKYCEIAANRMAQGVLV